MKLARLRGTTKARDVFLYSLVALGAFLCCLTVLLLLIFNAEKLTGLGLTGHVYYLVLVLMGAGSAVFLFGVLQSSATYQGRLLGGTLKLGGPIVAAALVVFGGYFFAPKAPTFSLTVFVHGLNGPQDAPLRNSGHVILELGPDIRQAAIGENGEAYFAAIPANFRNEEVLAWVESDTYETVNARIRCRLSASSLQLTIQKKINRYKLAGSISDSLGNPLSGVHVMAPEYGVQDKTNLNGRFSLQVAADGQQSVEVIAQKKGYTTVRLSPTLGDSGVNFTMQRNR